MILGGAKKLQAIRGTLELRVLVAKDQYFF
jgi:hypothetical protein